MAVTCGFARHWTAGASVQIEGHECCVQLRLQLVPFSGHPAHNYFKAPQSTDTALYSDAAQVNNF